MKYVKFLRPARGDDYSRNVLHIETALATINIYIDLHDHAGHEVERIEVTPVAGVQFDGQRLRKEGLS